MNPFVAKTANEINDLFEVHHGRDKLSKTIGYKLVYAVFTVMKEHLKKGENIRIRNFGSFKWVYSRGKRRVRFFPGVTFKRLVSPDNNYFEH